GLTPHTSDQAGDEPRPFTVHSRADGPTIGWCELKKAGRCRPGPYLDRAVSAQPYYRLNTEGPTTGRPCLTRNTPLRLFETQQLNSQVNRIFMARNYLFRQ